MRVGVNKAGCYDRVAGIYNLGFVELFGNRVASAYGFDKAVAADDYAVFDNRQIAESYTGAWQRGAGNSNELTNVDDRELLHVKNKPQRTQRTQREKLLPSV